MGRHFDFNDEIHATTIRAADLAAEKTDLTALLMDTHLPGEPKEDQDRIKGLRNQARTTKS